MQIETHIARKYFPFGKKFNFINIITLLSIGVVMVVTMAMIIVMSVFNGMEDLIRSIYKTFDADIKITAVEGKSFGNDLQMKKKLNTVPGIAVLTEVLEDNAMVTYGEERDVVRLKGVETNYTKHHKLDSNMIGGKFILSNGQKQYAVAGSGVAYKLSLNLDDPFTPMVFYYPNAAKLRKLNSSESFQSFSILPSGVFAIEKQYDDQYVFVPITFAESLFDKAGKRTSYEIKIKEGYSMDEVQKTLKAVCGDKFLVQNSDEQHASLIKAIKIEKVVVYIILSSLLAVSSVGIYFCLTMLVIRKRKDIVILKSMGAKNSTIRKIFLIEGTFIAFSGAITGIFLGGVICFVQQQYGIVSMGLSSAIVESYPVEMQWQDFVLTSLIVIALTMIASWKPASKAAELPVQLNLD